MDFDYRSLLNRSKPAFVVILIAIVLVVSGLVYWVFYPRSSILVEGVSPEKTLAITQVLEKEKIQYQLQEQGGVLSVAQSDLEQARLKIYAADSTLAHEVGLELFSGNDLGMTDFTQHVNLVRALQGELARTISRLPGIATARVHVSIPEMSASTRSRQIQPRAAVTLTLRDGKTSLPQERIVAIQQLVAAAIPGLTIERVSVIDGRGIPVTSSDEGEQGRFRASRQTQESYLEEKIKQLLRPMIGPDGEMSVAVAISYSQAQKRVSKDMPVATGNVRGMQTGVLQSSKTKSDGASNPESDASPSGTSDEELVFTAGRIVEQMEEGPDKVIRISASVIIGKARYWLDAPTYERIISTAIGLETARGDLVSVELLPAVPGENVVSSLPKPLEPEASFVTETVEKPGIPAARPGADHLGWIAAATLMVFLLGQTVFRHRRHKQVSELTRALRAHLSRLRSA